MNFTTYIRKPFEVEAVQITEENIQEIADLIGVVRTVKTDSGVKRYIAIDRLIIPNVHKAVVGSWLTKMGPEERYHCYADRVFKRMFEKRDYC